VVSSRHVIFPGGAQARRVLCLKILDLLYLSLRIGFEMTRQHMTLVLQKFFAIFSRVHEKQETAPEEADVENSSESVYCDDYYQNYTSKTNKTFSSAGDAADEQPLYYEMKMDSTTQDYFIESMANRAAPPNSGASRHNSVAKTPEGNENLSEQEIQTELLSTFTSELAHTAYVMFCRLAGG
jgi:hypothetical protein